MKKKFILLFDEYSEIAGMEKAYVFCNEKDAESFLLSYESFIDVKIRPDEGYFSFKLNGWSESGKCFWAGDKC